MIDLFVLLSFSFIKDCLLQFYRYLYSVTEFLALIAVKIPE